MNESTPDIHARIADLWLALADITEAIAMNEITIAAQNDGKWPPFEATPCGAEIAEAQDNFRAIRADIVRALSELRAGIVRDSGSAVRLAPLTHNTVIVTGRLAAIAVEERAKY